MSSHSRGPESPAHPVRAPWRNDDFLVSSKKVEVLEAQRVLHIVKHSIGGRCGFRCLLFFRMIWTSPPRNKKDAIYIYINQNNCQKVVLVKGQIRFEVFAGSAKTIQDVIDSSIWNAHKVHDMDGKKRVEVPKNYCAYAILITIYVFPSVAVVLYWIFVRAWQAWSHTHTYIKKTWCFPKKTSTTYRFGSDDTVSYPVAVGIPKPH